MSVSQIGMAVVGMGYWGPNLARNFDQLDGSRLLWCCDSDPANLNRFEKTFNEAKMSDDLDQVLADDLVDAVVIATDVPSHPTLALRALEAGKHCFVEKPLAQRWTDAQQVAESALERGLTLMVGHLLIYHPGVVKLKEIVDSGELGDLHYIYGNRLNLGKLRADENALWSLGAHDVSVLLHLLDQEPVSLSAKGYDYVRDGVEDVVFCHLNFESGVSAHLHLSWLDPHKARRFTVVGSKQMATFDDMELERKIVIYDKGFDRDFSSYGEYITRAGGISSPQISNEEPLKLECGSFLECISSGSEPLSGPKAGVEVVRVLEALQRSLDSGGETIFLETGVVES